MLQPVCDKRNRASPVADSEGMMSPTGCCAGRSTQSAGRVMTPACRDRLYV